MSDAAPFWRSSESRRGIAAAEIVPLAIFAGFALVPLAAAFGPQAYILDLFTRVMIFSIAALGLDLIVGYGALVSFGHAAFMGLGRRQQHLPDGPLLDERSPLLVFRAPTPAGFSPQPETGEPIRNRWFHRLVPMLRASRMDVQPVYPGKNARCRNADWPRFEKRV